MSVEFINFFKLKAIFQKFGVTQQVQLKLCILHPDIHMQTLSSIILVYFQSKASADFNRFIQLPALWLIIAFAAHPLNISLHFFS